MKVALLVIDMQKCFLAEYPDRAVVDEACAYINYAASLVRKAGQTVIHVQDISEAGQIDAARLEFTDAITVEPGDLRVTKTYSNAFWQTELEKIVRERSLDFLVMSGQAAEFCVVFTYNGAIERGFSAAILQNGVASAKPDRLVALYQDRPVIAASVLGLLAAGA